MPETKIISDVAKRIGFADFDMFRDEMEESHRDLLQAANNCNLFKRGAPGVFSSLFLIEHHGDVIEDELATAVNANKITELEYKQAFKEVEDFVEGSKQSVESILKTKCGCQFMGGQ
jgi:hypothetical protein